MASRSDDASVLQFPILIGDIGGTNARFAILVDAYARAERVPNRADGGLRHHRRCDPRGHPRPHARSSRARRCLPSPARSTATRSRSPTAPGWCGRAACSPRSALRDVVILNDFEAQALAVVALGEEHMEKIGGGDAGADAGRVVLGPGTGLGVAGLIHACGTLDPGARRRRPHGYRPAHAARFRDLPASRDRSRAAFRASRSCAAAAWSTSTAPSPRPMASTPRFTTPAEITGAALASTDAVAEEALSLFVTCLGRTAGDLALVFKSRGGVFLTGGIAQKIVPALKSGEFPRRLRGQGAAQRADALRCRSMSSPIRWRRWPGLPPMRAQPDAFRRRNRGPALVVAIMQRRAGAIRCARA